MKLHRNGNITLYYTQLIMARSEALARLFDQPICAIHRRFEVCRASFAPVPCLNKQTGPSPLPLKLGVNSACENRQISHLGQPVSKRECELFHIYFVKYSHQKSSWPC